jgi:hypothetical protein
MRTRIPTASVSQENKQTASLLGVVNLLRSKSFFLLPLLLLAFVGFVQTIQTGHASLIWSSPILIDNGGGTNTLSSVLQASNGTLWLAWQSNRNSITTGRTDVLYKTYTNGVWSTDHNLTSSGWNISPTLIQLPNGTIGMFWSYKPAQSYEVYSAWYSSAGWSTPTNVTSTSLNDTLPAATVGLDGTVWLVWTRINSSNSTAPPLKQLFYKTWKNGVWSPESQLTNDSNQNFGASVMIGKDGIVRVTWSKGVAGSNYQLYTKTYNGVSWSSDTQIISTVWSDGHPSMIQDRNGTLWLFWARFLNVTGGSANEIYGSHSYNMGNTWSNATQMTPTPTGSTLFDSFMPNAVQSTYATKPIWVFYTSNMNVNNFDIYALQSSGINLVHDVVVSGLTAANNQGTPWEYPGGQKAIGESAIETVTVSVSNIGDYVETVNATLTATNTTSITIGTSIKNLIGPGNTAKLYFYWNTTSISPGRYGLTVSLTLPPGELTIGNTPDTHYSRANQIHIIPIGDVNHDGVVNIVDLTLVAISFGSSVGSASYNPYADIDDLGTINIIDLVTCAQHFGQTG